MLTLDRLNGKHFLTSSPLLISYLTHYFSLKFHCSKNQNIQNISKIYLQEFLLNGKTV